MTDPKPLNGETPYAGDPDIQVAAEDYGKSVMGVTPEPDRPRP